MVFTSGVWIFMMLITIRGTDTHISVYPSRSTRQTPRRFRINARGELEFVLTFRR